ncbi:NUDIX domain-containing protein [candidate division WWE3 bacterium]|uniref:NUDIX domain-containing protein n=1 Tax=candidate division WWE3 bacterium TaxID=2053526 RepID=A0A955LJL4_UNCKA|nr:NUDIX domain-containing protein [candidate division WWE3 bacterium]
MDDRHIGVGAGVIIIKGNQTLLTKRKGSHGEGTYGSLGGHVEFGETPTDAVRREAMEELGVTLKNINFVSCTNMVKYGKHYVDITFFAEIETGEPTIMEPGRIESVGWYKLTNLPSPLFEPVRIALDAYKNKTSYFEVQ